MTEEKRRHKTTIAGRPYTIIASKTPEHLQAVADLVEEQISQIEKAMPILDVEQRSILVAVNAVSQSLDRQQELDELKEHIAELEKDREDLLRELHAYEELLEEVSPEEFVVEPEADAEKEWSAGRHLATEGAELRNAAVRQDEEATQPKPEAKKAKLRFVRPTTASQAFLQHMESREQSAPSGENLSRTRRNRNYYTDHGE